MGGLKGMFGQNPVQTGTNILGMGMEMAFKKQAMDLDMQQKQMQMNLEKQKFDLLSSLQKAEEQRNKTLFKQQQDEMKSLNEWNKKVFDIVSNITDAEGNIDTQKVTQLMALKAAHPSGKGEISPGLLKLLQPEKKPIKIQGNRFVQDGQVVGEVPKTQRELEAEAEKKRKEEEAKAEKAKKEYNQKLKERKADITKLLKEKGEYDKWSARRIEDEAVKQLGEEAFRAKRGYLPIRGEWKEPGYLGRLGNILGIGPDYNFGGNLNVKHVTPKLNPLNMMGQSAEEQEFINYLVQNKKMTLEQARAFAKDALK